MCTHTIIDASVCGKIDSAQMQPLLGWIKRGHGILVYTDGGRYDKELRNKACKKAYDLFMSYRRSGQARLFRWNQVGTQESELDSATLRSNDPHIIALAQASDTLVLCTCDGDLKEDFLNRELLPHVNRRRRAVYPLRITRKRQQDFLRSRECPRHR